MGIKIKSAGTLTIIQSAIPVCLTDYESIITANRLVSNTDAEGVLEMTQEGICGKFTADGVIALTGADMAWELNGKDLPVYKAVEVKKGDLLTSEKARYGYRGYMAAAGGFDIPLVDGSYQTNLDKATGGFEGRKLTQGDVLNFRFERTQLLGKYKGHTDTPDFPDFPDDDAEIRILSEEDISNKDYTVKFFDDKIGIFLEDINGNTISADNFNILDADRMLLAQACCGTKVRFISVNEKEAKTINFKYKMKLAWLGYKLMF